MMCQAMACFLYGSHAGVWEVISLKFDLAIDSYHSADPLDQCERLAKKTRRLDGAYAAGALLARVHLLDKRCARIGRMP